MSTSNTTPETTPSEVAPENAATGAGAATGGEAAAAEALAALTAERDDLKDKWARARADLENYRKRVQRELEEERKYQSLPLLKAILPGLDGLVRAVEAAEKSRNADELITGVKLTLQQMETALQQLGAKLLDTVGQPFDPNLHEAISQAPSVDHPAMTVLMDVERGCILHDRVVRPSKVIVSCAPPSA